MDRVHIVCYVSHTMRAHIIVPDELVTFIDEHAGVRGRSKFFVNAAVKEVKRIRCVEVARKVAGSLAIPGWETSERAEEWVRNLRKADDDSLQELLNKSK
jgi:hypothetical protein